MNRLLSKVIRQKIFYPFWSNLNKLSLYGMNYGVASGYADYSGELYIIKKLKPFCNGGVVFDIGANVGDWSKFVIKEYHDIEYNLYMFEPSKPAFEKLKINIKDEVHLNFYQLGFGDKKETIKIYYDDDAQGSAGAFVKDAKLSEDIEIDTIDDFCKKNNIENISFLKMDVQGYEYNILKGSSEMLKNGKIDCIQFEIDEPNIENRIFFKDFWKLLHKDYRIYHSLYNGLVEIKEYSFSMENYNCMNYLAVRK